MLSFIFFQFFFYLLLLFFAYLDKLEAGFLFVFLSCLFMTLDLENLKILQQYHLDFEAGFAVKTVFFYPSSLNDELLDPILTFFFHIFSHYLFFFFNILYILYT